MKNHKSFPCSSSSFEDAAHYSLALYHAQAYQIRIRVVVGNHDEVLHFSLIGLHKSRGVGGIWRLSRAWELGFSNSTGLDGIIWSGSFSFQSRWFPPSLSILLPKA